MDTAVNDERSSIVSAWSYKQFALPPRYYFPIVSLLLWLVLGLYIYMLRPWGTEKHYYTLGESLYLMVQIITTIGYGDRPGPCQPKGFLFATCYVIVGVCACANLVSVMVDQIRNRARTVHNATVGKLSRHTINMLRTQTNQSVQVDRLKSFIPRSIYRPIRRRWYDLKQLLHALVGWNLFLAVGTVFYANYCETSTCVKGHCCKSWHAEKMECEHILPIGCKSEYTYNGTRVTGCVEFGKSYRCSRTDQYEPGSEKGVGWETCHSPYRTQEAAFRKAWRITWPGGTSQETRTAHDCSETTAICCEGKTYLQALYMSVVTLTTVGFGDQTPTTHGGIWFAIPWMLFGVAAFANLVAKFAFCREDRERMENCNIPSRAVLRAEFILHALKQDGIVSEDLVKQISRDFKACDRDRNGWLDENDLRALSPPAAQAAAPAAESSGMLELNSEGSSWS